MTQGVDFQVLFNVAISLASFFGGWIFKRNFEMIDTQEAKIDEVRTSVHNIEVNLPSKYVNKEDLNTFVKQINSRFDKIDDKLDNIIASKSK